MAGSGIGIDSEYSNSSTAQESNLFPLTILTTLFFAWGFITSLNEILVPLLRDVFSLSYFQAMAVQSAFFGAYPIVSYPAGSIIRKIGYQKGIVLGLGIAATGCIGFYPAAEYREYALFLGSLFVLAAGVTILQVSANPFVTALGKPETASSRLTTTQAFNSLGATVGPLFGGILILAAATASLEGAVASAEQKASSVQIPYLILAASLATLAVIMAFIKLPKISHQSQNDSVQGSAWKQTHLVLGAVGIFVYVGAEVAIGSFIISFLGQDNIAGMAQADAAHYVSYYFGGAMIGRFIGAYIMLKIPANKVLASNAFASVILLIVAMAFDGAIAMWAIVAVGLFNSIMFPTIFSLAVNKLGALTGQGSGILCMAIAGGAIIPPMQGALADSIGIQLAFILPLLCYVYITFYGLKGYQVSEK